MKTYKVTFAMEAPLAFTDPPMFDSLISYAYAREVLGDKFSQKLNISPNEMLDYSKMPIVQHKNGYFMASRMFWDEENAISHIQRWRKRWAAKRDYLTDFEKKKRKVRINAGEYKSYDMPLTCITTHHVWFYFQSDDIQKVKILLKKWIHFIGKKRSQGYGFFNHFEIEESNYDFPIGFRPIPVRFLKPADIDNDCQLKYTSWKPPYWLPDNFENCVY